MNATILIRRLTSIALMIGALLYVPYALYNAKVASDSAATAMSVRGEVMRQDEVTCHKKGKNYRVCEVAVIALTNTTPPWTGRVVVDTSSNKSSAEELLAAIKPRDVLSLYAVTHSGKVTYISEDGLSSLKRKSAPTDNLLLLFAPLFFILGLVTFVSNRR